MRPSFFRCLVFVPFNCLGPFLGVKFRRLCLFDSAKTDCSQSVPRASGGAVGRSGRIRREWGRTFLRLNARGVYFTAQKALPLLADKASIILSGSAAWQMGIPGYGAYSATKAALVSFVRTWTAELASRGIRANVISPGPTETPMVHVGSKGSPEGTSEYFRKMIPMGRLGTPEELASAVVFLASDESSFITGIDLPVDGGTASR
jgi:NAD(P)-dependent dehydrogenase (short-subunit alcohol dehydrogenase family)